jgi:hypothetical protein
VVAADPGADPADPGDVVGAGVAARVDTAVASTLAAAVAGLPGQDVPVPSPAIAFGAAGPGR